MFAARAIKSAIFGSPVRKDEVARRPAKVVKAFDDDDDDEDFEAQTPTQPQGILLTPGTGTSRPKRVSFGHDVMDTVAGRAARKITSPRRKSKLTETLERSRTKPKPQAQAQAQAQAPQKAPVAKESDDEWVEEDWDVDQTLDINEPHSESGKFWKQAHEKYHADARAEMEKLLKYKQLAKSYAEQKDSEAVSLAEQLREEQDKVVQMEKKISASTSNIASRRGREGGGADTEGLSRDLARQTASVGEYRDKVQDLEGKLEEVMRARGGVGDDGDGAGSKPAGRAGATPASPGTQRTLLETQRELRNARTQARENASLKDEIKRLKEDVERANRRADRRNEPVDDSPRLKDLRAKLVEAELEVKRKDEEISCLRADYDDFKRDALAKKDESDKVLLALQNKMADQKKEIRSLKSRGTDAAYLSRSTKEAHIDDMMPKVPARKTLSAPVLIDDTQPPAQKTLSAPVLIDDTQDSFTIPPPKPEATAQDHPVLLNKVNLPSTAKRWQPYIPRSPRPDPYLPPRKTEPVQGLTASHETLLQPQAFDDEGETFTVDLLSDRFRSLNAPPASRVADCSKSTMSPGRYAAAQARLARKRATRGEGGNKENVRPRRT